MLNSKKLWSWSVLFSSFLLVNVSFAGSYSVSEFFPKTNFRLNVADCQMDAKAIDLWWKLAWSDAGNLPLSWAAYLYQDQGSCPMIYVIEPVHKMLNFKNRVALQKSMPYIPTDEAERAFTAQEILGETICSGNRNNYRLCLYSAELDPNENANPQVPQASVVLLSEMLISVDSIAPPQAEMESPITTDKSIKLVLKNFEIAAGESYSYQIQYRSCALIDPDAGTSNAALQSDAGVDAGTENLESLCEASQVAKMKTLKQKSLLISSLDNDQKYEFRVALVDDFGNVGPYSELLLASPDSGFTPVDLYQGNDNDLTFEGPSCHHASLKKLFVFQIFAIVFFFLRFRQGRKRQKSLEK